MINDIQIAFICNRISEIALGSDGGHLEIKIIPPFSAMGSELGFLFSVNELPVKPKEERSIIIVYTK
jgi:hypothetical protein